MYLIVKKDKKLSNTFAVYDYDENKIIKLNTEYMSKNSDLILNVDAINNPDSLENKWAILKVSHGEALIGLDYDDDKNDFREIIVVDVKDIIVNSNYSLNKDFQYVTKGGMWGCHKLYRHLHSKEVNKELYGSTAENNKQHEESDINTEDIVSFDEIVEEHVAEDDSKEKDENTVENSEEVLEQAENTLNKDENTVECDEDTIEDKEEYSDVSEDKQENVEALESVGNDNYFVSSHDYVEESKVHDSNIGEYINSEEYNKLYGIKTSSTSENNECSIADTYSNDKDTKFSYIDILKMMYEEDRISMALEDYNELSIVSFKILRMNMDGTSYTSVVVIKESTENFIVCIADVKNEIVSVTKIKEQNLEKLDEKTLLNVENQFKRWDKRLKVR